MRKATTSNKIQQLVRCLGYIILERDVKMQQHSGQGFNSKPIYCVALT